jgi:hypothetical protein
MYRWEGCDILDGDSVTGLGAEIVELLNDTLLAVRILAKRVDDPDLTQVDGSSQSGSLGVIRDELDVLDTTALFS